MSIYEYDKEFEEKKLRKAEYEAGRQDGIEIGRQDGIEIGRQDGIEIGKQELLKSKVEKKWKKGKTIEQIADDLEEEVIIIQRIIESLSKKKEE